MKNLRGSVLTLLAAIMVVSVANHASAQLPPPNLGGALPTPSNAVPPGSMAGPLAGPMSPQGVMMPPPQAMQQFAGPAVANQTPLAVAQIPATSAAYGMAAQQAYSMPALQQGYGPTMGMQPNWGVQPASYGPPQPLPAAAGTAMPVGYNSHIGHSGGCASCGGHGCAACLGHGVGGGNFLNRLVDRLLPYAEGGQCAPRWYDLTFDAMYLSRDNAGRNIDLSSDGINGNTILSTGDLSLNDELGFRLTAAKQIFAGATAEFTYFGLFNWDATNTTAISTLNGGDIFSVLSNFGQNPFNGFDETDRAWQHGIRFSSTIDNFELNFRKRFTAPNCRLQYSWLAGIRYVYLLEDFEYATTGGDLDLVTPGLQSRGSMDYDVRARNSLTGFQIGGDAWLNMVPGVNIGADIKAGIYGNYANQTTNITATTTAPNNVTTFGESLDVNDVALVTDANLYFMWRLGPHWTIRAGYNFMFIDGVALGPENFNTVAPNILTGGVPGAVRVASVNDNGNVFYHGGFAGVEWMW